MATTQSVRTQKTRKPKSGSGLRAKSATQKRKRASSPASPSSQDLGTQNQPRLTLTGTRIFDRSLHKTNTWLKELMVAMNWKNREKALRAFRATLHSLRDVMPLQEIPQLASQFPIMIRGLYYENWRLLQEPLKIKSVNEFYELVRTKLGRGAFNFSTDELKKFTRTSLQLIAKHVSRGEMKDVKNSLKANLKELFEESQSSGVKYQTSKRTKRSSSRRSKNLKPAQVH